VTLYDTVSEVRENRWRTMFHNSGKTFFDVQIGYAINTFI
jgi:hypothetical protein